MLHPSTDKINNYYQSGAKKLWIFTTFTDTQVLIVLVYITQIPKNSLCRSIYRKMVGIETLDALLIFPRLLGGEKYLLFTSELAIQRAQKALATCVV